MKEKEARKYELMHEYIRIRIEYYVENMIPEQKLRDYEEIRLHDNIMELLSMIDYAGDKLSPYIETLVSHMQKRHEETISRLIRQGKYKII